LQLPILTKIKLISSNFYAYKRQNGILNAIKKTIGFSDALVYSLAGKTWSSLSGLVTIVFITTYFTAEVQGYYYLFNSLLIFNSLLDVGFGVVLVQFASHEWAHLGFGENNSIIGRPEAMMRLASLVRLAQKWYIAVAAVFFILVGFGGYFYIKHSSNTEVNFTAPWFLLVAAVSVSILIAPYKYLLDGTNQIKLSQKILFFSYFAGTIGTWFSIYFHLGLYTNVISISLVLIVTVLMLYKRAAPFIVLTKLKGTNDKLFWKCEFWGQQWRIGLSWFCGFLMYQIFVPVLFYFQGSVVAGKMGATMQIYSALTTIGFAWANVEAPKLGMLGALKKYSEIKAIVNRISIISMSACFVIGIMLLAGMQALKFFKFGIVDRFADIYVVAAMVLAAIIAQRINIETMAIRYQKIEPFLTSGIVSSLITFLLIILLAKYYSIYGVIVGFYIGVVFISFVWSHIIYKKNILLLINKAT
jgi:hypothetical protein